MVLKTFNVDENTYKKYSEVCKELGISMSKQIDTFMKSQLAQEPVAKRAYLEKLDIIRQGTFVQVDDFAQRYGLKK